MGRHLRRSSLAALILFVLVVVAALLYVQRNNPWLAERVAGLVTRNLLARRGYSLHLEGIEGHLPGEIVLHGLRVSYLGSGHTPFDLFTARRVALRFSVAGLLRGDFLSESLRLEGAVLRAYKVRATGWAYPGFDTQAGGRSDVQVALDAVSVDRLLLLRETAAGPDTLVLREAVCRVYRNAEGSSVDLDSLRIEHSGRPPVALSGLFLLREGGQLGLAGVDLSLPESRLGLRGEVGLAGGLSAQLALSLTPVRLRELGAALGQELDTESLLTGQLQCAGPLDSLALAGRLSGTLYDFRLDSVDCRGLYTDGRLHFAALRGRLNDNALDAAAVFTLPLGGRGFGYQADAALSHLDLATFFPDGLPTDLSGALNIVDPGGAGRFRFDLGPGRVERYPFGAARGRLDLRGDTLDFSEVEVRDRGLTATLAGRLLPGAEQLDFVIEAVSDSARLAGTFAGDSLLGGHIELSGRFTGPVLAPAMDLSGRFARLRYFGALLGRGEFALRSDALELQPTRIHAEGDSLRYLGQCFARYYLDAELLGDTLRLRHASLDGASLSLDLSGRLAIDPQRPRLRLERAWLRWQGEDWLNEGPLDLRLGEAPGLALTRWRGAEGSLALRWNRPEQGPDRLELVDVPLSQLSPWLPPALGLAGRLSGVLERQGPAAYALRARLERLELGGEPAGRVELALHWRGDSLAVDSLRWEPAAGELLRLRGGLAGLPDAAGGPAALAELALPRLVAALGLEAEGFAVERLCRLWPTSAALAGRLSGRFRIAGPLGEPAIGGEARLDSARYGPIGVDGLSAVASLAAGQLELRGLRLTRGASRIEGWLGLPLDLGLGRRPRPLAEGALRGELAVDIDARDLSGLDAVVAEAGGRLAGELSLAGSPAAPRPQGRLRLTGGLLRLAGWEERLQGMTAELSVAGDTLRVESLRARAGIQWSRFPEGGLEASGWLTWRPPFRYFARAHLDRCAFGTLPFFSGLISGELTLGTWEPAADIPAHPYLRGSLTVHEGTLSYDFQDVAETPGPTVAPVLSYELAVRADQNLRLVNKEADLELSGDLRLVSTPAGQDVSGELSTLRGSYFVFGNRFHLVQGDLDFSSAEDINPKIDILAEARHRDDKIQIHITNTFAEPEIEVISEQGYSREDVLRILMGLPAESEAAGGATGTAVAGRVEAELLNRLERVVSDELSGVVDFGLENRNLEGSGGDVETRWRIGRYLPGGFYISYNQGLSMESDREVALEYRLYNRLYLRSEVVNRARGLGDEGLVNEYNVDIRFRYEY